jgi:hypothetical protein
MTELIADVKEWERRMRLREFFFDQNEEEDVLTDDQKQYNFIKKKKSNWTPPTGRSEWSKMISFLVSSKNIGLTVVPSKLFCNALLKCVYNLHEEIFCLIVNVNKYVLLQKKETMVSIGLDSSSNTGI